MTSDATLVLNLTFLGTVMIAALLGGLIVFFACVAMAFTGLGRLAYVGVARLLGKVPPARGAAKSTAANDDGAKPAGRAVAARAAAAVVVAKGLGAREKPKPTLNPGWQQAVREADARALAKATDSGILPTVAKVSNPAPKPAVKAQELLAAPPEPVATKNPAAKNPAAQGTGGDEDTAPKPGRPTTLRPVATTGPVRTTGSAGPVGTAGKAPRLSLKRERQEGIARKNMPGLVLPAQDDEEQHAKGA